MTETENEVQELRREVKRLNTKLKKQEAFSSWLTDFWTEHLMLF